MRMLPNETSAEQQVQTSADGRQGFALAGALLALVVVGALLTGSFYAANQEQSIGISSRYSDEALYVTEAAIDSADAGMTKTALKAMTVGSTLQVLNQQAISDGSGHTLGNASVWVTRLTANPDRFLYIGRGSSIRGGNASGQGTRMLGLMTQTIDVSFPLGTAMQLWAGIDVKGNSVVNGNDMYPTGGSFGAWSGCTTTGAHAGIVTRGDTSQVNVTGSAQVLGASPPIVRDATLDSASFLKFGSTNYAELASEADKTIAAGTTLSQVQPTINASSTCKTSDLQNWGEPGTTDSHATIYHQCDQYFPIIHALGDLHITGARGQGILLVDGNLDISGGFDFWGVTVVRGTVSTSGTGGHFYGTVLAFDKGNLDYDNVSTGNSVVNYSTCAIQRASANVEGFNYAVPIKAHSWIDLTATNAGY